MRAEIVSLAYKYGLVLTPEALEYVVYSVRNPERLFRRLSKEGLRVVRKEDLLEVRPRKRRVSTRREVVKEERGCERRIRILLYVDPDEINPPYWEREQMNILESRLEFLEGEIMRIHKISPVEYHRALRGEEERYVVGVVFGVEVGSRLGKVTIENKEDTLSLIFPPGKNSWKLSYIDMDCVVGLKVRGGERPVVEDVLFPAAPRTPPPAGCTYRLLVVPRAYRHSLRDLPLGDVDGVVLLSDVIDVYKTVDIKGYYRQLDELLVSLEKDVFIVPGMHDAVRSTPPHPPLEAELMPNSFSSDTVHLLGSPALVRIGHVDVLFYDGEYYAHTGRSQEMIFYTRLIQPNISSYPYLSSRDYSLLKKPPHVVILPLQGGLRVLGDMKIVSGTEPFVVEIYSGKVVSL